MSTHYIEVLERALKREKAARKQAEVILERKSAELFEAKQRLEKSYAELETLLNRKDSQLQGVFENIVDAYVIMSLEGDILKMNQSALDLLGFESVNQNYNLLSLAHPDEKDRVAKSFQLLLNKGALTNFHLNIITLKKQAKLVHINASVIYDEGIAVAAQGIVRDITLDNKYQKRIEAEREKYSRIIANMNLGLLEVDKTGAIKSTNNSFVTMSGYSKQELIGKNAVGVFPFISNDDTQLSDHLKLESHTTQSHEVQIKNKLGHVKYWLVSSAPNYNINGDFTGYIHVHLDITDIKQLESQKEKLVLKLKKSNEALEEYAHIVSHDLKSPLRSINALVSWLKEDNAEKLDTASLQNFNLIEQTLEKMENLIGDILNYSSISTNNNDKVNVNLNNAITALIKVMYKPAHVKITILNPLPTLIGDQTKLEQLFQNLLSNAVKFIDKTEGYVNIDVKDQGTHYLFSITDNGMGIERKFHDKIFKIFHALNKSKNSTGIGLSIVKKIIDLHEGDIWLESELKVGTTFFFTLKK